MSEVVESEPSISDKMWEYASGLTVIGIIAMYFWWPAIPIYYIAGTGAAFGYIGLTVVLLLANGVVQRFR